MKLTGKAKEDFESWVLKSDQNHDSNKMIKVYNQREVFVSYLGIGNTFLNALIIEFFDSVGITVDVMPILNNPIKWMPNTFWIEKNISTDDSEYYETRQEATNQAILTANKLYNETN